MKPFFFRVKIVGCDSSRFESLCRYLLLSLHRPYLLLQSRLDLGTVRRLKQK
jgi:hypothetical protein